MNRSRRSDNLLPLDPEIERTARKARARIRNQRTEEPLDQQQQPSQNIMAEEQPPPPQRSLRDYSNPTTGNIGTSITRPQVTANHFEIKTTFISFIKEDQFYGHLGEDPNDHLALFSEKCDTLKMNGVTEDALRLRLFPFSLAGKAK